MTLPEQIKHLLPQDKPRETIVLINQLSQQELETRAQGNDDYLFDFAVRHSRNPQVLHALIARYASLVGNKRLKPLTLDCHSSFSNHLDEAFIMGKLPILRHGSLTQYKNLMNLQKTIYCHRLMDEIKKLSLYGAKLLLEVLKPAQKQVIEQAIIQYEKMLIDYKDFNAILSASEPLDRAAETFKKAAVIQKMAFQLVSLTYQFLGNDQCALISYQDAAKDILDSHPAIIRTCRGLGKIITDIGNAIAYYTGLGLLVSFSQGKVQEFKTGRWTLFAVKSKTQQQQEMILDLLETFPPLL
ncbi:hypothetical protein DIZ81_11430 [Legionella taurinensis]|uniref:Uncharacterized protein n=1 Tax=Legionella taurinensis TaxID=70611 RepID=A0A3A5LBF7_9GAMM|nr:hypothetical protein [Legionella taurinensis]MDX1838570.1 hypothetical protein [Legionella taurinensis]PUT39016.1 hypothetical protein DB744_11440 [Legionella taurinensis]PUT41103.1 hypothetical protein DB746_09830 [Legionella taurinensis]PUT43478.1 hypothetical protein DB743_10835 [Legionella taurinensis]PUT46495.1 hypothetical protein DB745_10320 [Legionella taurinensis]